MFSCVKSGTVYGMESFIVSVETDVSPGLPGFDMVGMLNSEVKEAKERVKVSLRNNGFVLPSVKVTVNLSPANLRKNGTKFDLPIAISLLVALGEIEQSNVDDCLILGELGLDGELKFVEGVLPIALEARNNGIKNLIVPKCNEMEAVVVEDLNVYGVTNIVDAIRLITNWEDVREEFLTEKIDIDKYFEKNQYGYNMDYSEVSSQLELKRAAMIAAAGFHNMLMIGTPGSGKSLIAKRFPTILPPLSYKESLEVSKVYSIAGFIKEGDSLIVKRPFISPHHTSSSQSLVGGGSVPKPGLISLSHRGVLFLDEAVHFQTSSLEALRQPLEDKFVTISRSNGKFTYPSDFMLLAAINPCPCGYYPNRNKCKCSEKQITMYLSRISGPILDRIDICASSSEIEFNDLMKPVENKTSEEMRNEIQIAIDIQNERFAKSSIRFNSEMSVDDIKKHCILSTENEEFLERAYKKLNISARGYHKILKVARTIADMNESANIERSHLAEAINYRVVRNKFW